MALSASILIATRSLTKPESTEIKNSVYFLISASWIYSSLILIANTQRVATRYEIYFFIPIILTAAKTLDTIPVRRIWSTFLLPAWSAAVLIASACSSAQNISGFRERINPGQDRSVLCIGHHMDRTMKLTSASECEAFPNAMLDKDVYDSWSGPR